MQDLGTETPEPVDYPDVAASVARVVARGEADAGIVIDGAGIGSAIAANKVPGVRAVMAVSELIARYSREHNGANVLTLGFIETNASAPLLDDPVIGPAVRAATGGRPPSALDVARAVAFLASVDGCGFNGANLVLDRGMTAMSHVPDLRPEA